MAYEFDIFISYRRTETVGRWVHNHLLPRLDARLNEAAPHPVRISCDIQMESGVSWPDELKRRVLHSGLLVMVCTADFFRSRWCMAEWQSFRERERQLGLFGPEHPLGLVYPIRYADGDHFHPEVQAAQCRIDFRSLNYPDEVFRSSPKYMAFDDQIQEMANELIPRLGSLPEWRNTFPVVEPEPLPPVHLTRPVL
jgi:hypothetical protein